MNASRHLRRKYWSYAAGWVICIYSTLYIVRPVCEFLKNNTPFALLTNASLIGLLVSLSIVLYRKARHQNALAHVLFVLVILAYVDGLGKILNPEEKIHFLEYGFLAYLVYRAVSIDVRGGHAYLCAFLLTAVFGWIDEGIQHLLPGRYYQIQDVLLNGFSAGLGLSWTFLFQQRNKHVAMNEDWPMI